MARKYGHLHEFERRNRPVEETVEEVMAGTVQKMSDAHRLDLSPVSLERALYRAQRHDLVAKLKGG